MIIMDVIGGNTNSYFAASAQLFNCRSGFNDFYLPIDVCQLNEPSPYTVQLTDGTSVSFGTESYVFIYCVPFIRRRRSCRCEISVNPSDTGDSSDICNSCDIQILTDTEFLPSFDCSNRLVGNCVGFDASGACIDNSSGVDPLPSPAPLNVPISAPLGTTIPPPIPTSPVPVTVPTSFSADPVSVIPSPTTRNAPNSSGASLGTSKSDERDAVQDSENERKSSSNSSAVGIAIGCVVGGLVLAVVTGMYILRHRQKKDCDDIQTSIKSSPIDPYQADMASDDELRSSQSPIENIDRIMTHMADETQPSNSTAEPQFSPITEVISNNFDADEMEAAGYSRDITVRKSNVTSPATEAPTHESHPPNFPEQYGVVPAENPTLDIHPVSPASLSSDAAAAEYQSYRDIPRDVAFGVSIATCSTISASSRTMAEPS
jgi:hypothetical protein